VTDDPLVIVPLPPLVTVLAWHEAQKGAPLTEAEVLEISGKAICMTMPRSEAAAMAAARGYDDIAPDRAWEEWSAARLALGLSGSADQ
jgi:hypothetical protein